MVVREDARMTRADGIVVRWCACCASRLPAEAALRPVFNELCFNLESFNPAFAACLLQASVSLGGGKPTQQQRWCKRGADAHAPRP